MKLKKLSIIIPTYNEEKNIGPCLKSIFEQDYPRELLQVVLVDGGSTDKTIEIAKKFGVEVMHNKFKVEEKGRPYAIETRANGEIIGSIDADNIIPSDKNWLRKMIIPFDNKEIFATDTLYYTYRGNDSMITKYNALIGGDDPIATYFGINDRLCFFNNKWTGMPHKEIDRGYYIEVEFRKDKIPAIGSNGFFFRKDIFDKVQHDPFIHPLFVYDAVNVGYKKMAKVKQGLIHVQSGSVRTFFRKKLRRIKRRYNEEIKWKYSYDIKRRDVIKTSLYLASVVLPLRDMIMGIYRKPEWVWLFHPIATFGLLGVYGYYAMIGMRKE